MKEAGVELEASEYQDHIAAFFREMLNWVMKKRKLKKRSEIISLGVTIFNFLFNALLQVVKEKYK